MLLVWGWERRELTNDIQRVLLRHSPSLRLRLFIKHNQKASKYYRAIITDVIGPSFIAPDNLRENNSLNMY